MSRKEKAPKRRKLHYTKFWKRLVVFSILLMLATIILDIFFMSYLESHGLTFLVGAVDIPVSIILIMDVGFKFNDARDKIHFVRHNLLLIFSVLPISMFMLTFQMFRIFPALERLPLLGELAAFERIVKIQHGAKFIEGIRDLFRLR